MYRLLYIFIFWVYTVSVRSQTIDSLVVSMRPALSFPQEVPAANYSGITWLGGTLYAVVDDKSADDGFEMFDIVIDSISGSINSVKYLGHVLGEGSNRDQEGIAYLPETNKLIISGEKDDMIIEYDRNAKQTGRFINLPKTANNCGYEALTYRKNDSTIWTVSEGTLPADGEITKPGAQFGNTLRIKCFDTDFEQITEYLYQTEKPSSIYKAWHYADGVSAMATLSDGTLLLLEREFYVPELAVGSYVDCRLYSLGKLSKKNDALSDFINKKLLLSWRTSISLFRNTLANYEGMCNGPLLVDGSETLLLISDSQEQYGGLLKDFFSTIVIKHVPMSKGESSASPL